LSVAIIYFGGCCATGGEIYQCKVEKSKPAEIGFIVLVPPQLHRGRKPQLKGGPTVCIEFLQVEVFDFGRDIGFQESFSNVKLLSFLGSLLMRERNLIVLQVGG
jgi:hypothetical protein